MWKHLSGYDVGALLYCPANSHSSIVDSIVNEQFNTPYSIAFCLEDTVREEAVEEAELLLFQTLGTLFDALQTREFYLPLIFVRVRSPEQLIRLGNQYSGFSNILTGFILPKFFIENCDSYIHAIQKVLQETGHSYYYMPIFESSSMIEIQSRHENLRIVKEQLAQVKDQILNIRVGGNDFLHAFGLRRRTTDTIYDIKPVADLLGDIATTFATQYVVSGPVWEYYAGTEWDIGLRREIEKDMLSGFIGKTVIHPDQIPVVNEMLQVSLVDYKDACSILDWDPDDPKLVSANTTAVRMNEYNTHYRWASRISHLAQIYGIKEDL